MESITVVFFIGGYLGLVLLFDILVPFCKGFIRGLKEFRG